MCRGNFGLMSILDRFRFSELSLISVSIAPGQMALMRMSNGPSSTASILTMASCPALLTAYAVAPLLEKYRVPLMLLVTTMLPPPALSGAAPCSGS